MGDFAKQQPGGAAAVGQHRPRLLFTPDEARLLTARISPSGPDQAETSAEAPHGERVRASIDPAAIWHELKQQANLYADEAEFDVTYPSAPHVMHVKLPLEEPEPIPDPAGFVDYPYWTMYSRAVEERLTVLAAVYGLDGEERYVRKIKEYLLALAKFGKWYEFHRRGAEGNLSNAHFLIGYAVAYDAVHGQLTLQERDICRQAIAALGLQPLRIDFGSDDMHNIITSKQVAMLYGACAVYDEDEAVAAPYLRQAVGYLLAYLDRKLVTNETEGLLYTNVAARHVWMAAEVYRKATGDSRLCDHPYLAERLPELFLRMLSPGGESTFPNLSDSFEKLDVTYVMTMASARHRHPAAMWYVETFGRGKREALMDLTEPCEALHPDRYYADGKSAVFADIGWASLRSGWGTKDRMLVLTSSASAQGHNHLDQNNVMLNQSGEWLLVNPGYQDYRPGPGHEFTVGTVGHNSLLIDGQGQSVCGGGRIVGSYASPVFEWVSGDASSAYPELLASHVRTAYHINTGSGWFLLTDEVELLREEQRPELLFHTRAQFMQGDRKLQPGDRLPHTDGSHRSNLTLRGTRSSLHVHIISADPIATEIRVYPGAESYGPYAVISGQSGGLHRLYATLLIPADGSGLTSPVIHSSVDSEAIYLQITVQKSGNELGSSRFALSRIGSPVRLEAGRTSAQALALWTEQSPSGEISKAGIRQGVRLEEAGRLRLEADTPIDAAIWWQDREAYAVIAAACKEQARVSYTLGSDASGTLELQAGESRTVRLGAATA